MTLDPQRRKCEVTGQASQKRFISFSILLPPLSPPSPVRLGYHSSVTKPSGLLVGIMTNSGKKVVSRDQVLEEDEKVRRSILKFLQRCSRSHSSPWRTLSQQMAL